MSTPSFNVYLILLVTGPNQTRYMLALMPEDGSRGTFYYSDLDDADNSTSQAREAPQILQNQPLIDSHDLLLKEHLATFTGLANKALFVDKASRVLDQPHGRYVSQVLALLCGSGLIPNTIYGHWRFMLEPITPAARQAMNENGISLTGPPRFVRVPSSFDLPVREGTVSSSGGSRTGVVPSSQSPLVRHPSRNYARSDSLLQMPRHREVTDAAAASSDHILSSISQPSNPGTVFPPDPPRSQPLSTDPPRSQLLSTDPPRSQLLSTDPPRFQSLSTDPPRSQPLSTDPPRSQSLSTDPPRFQPLSTDPPRFQPLSTELLGASLEPLGEMQHPTSNPLAPPFPASLVRSLQPLTIARGASSGAQHPSQSPPRIRPRHNSPSSHPSPSSARPNTSAHNSPPPHPSLGPTRASPSTYPAHSRRPNTPSASPQPARHSGAIGSPSHNPSSVSFPPNLRSEPSEGGGGGGGRRRRERSRGIAAATTGPFSSSTTTSTSTSSITSTTSNGSGGGGSSDRALVPRARLRSRGDTSDVPSPLPSTHAR